MTLRAVLIALLLVVTVSAQAAAPQEIQMRYGVWAGGFQALDVHLRLRFSKTEYSAFMDAKPSGVLGRLLPWAGQYVSMGKIVNGELVPESHEKISAWRDDSDHLKISYKNGAVVSVHEVEKEGGKTVARDLPADPALTADSVDLVTAIVSMFRHATTKGNCDYRRIAFDGKRRFEIRFTDKGVEKLPASKRNIYGAQEARACQLELVPLAGFKKGRQRGFYKIQEDARKLGQMPRVWVAPAEADMPQIPVRMLVRSEYGAVFVHLRALQ